MNEELVNYLVKNKYFDFLFINEPLYKELKYCKIKTLISTLKDNSSNINMQVAFCMNNSLELLSNSSLIIKKIFLTKEDFFILYGSFGYYFSKPDILNLFNILKVVQEIDTISIDDKKRIFYDFIYAFFKTINQNSLIKIPLSKEGNKLNIRKYKHKSVKQLIKTITTLNFIPNLDIYAIKRYKLEKNDMFTILRLIGLIIKYIATYSSPSNNYLNIKDKIFDIISLYYEKHFESPIHEILDNSYFQKKWLKTFNNFLFEKIDSIGIEI